MIIYTCPRCGADLYTYVVTTFPPITVNSCSKCGWRYEDKCATADDIIRVPFPAVSENNGDVAAAQGKPLIWRPFNEPNP